MATEKVDLYEALGIARAASADALREAHRLLAKKYHPDLNPGDAAAEETFKRVQRAYDILSDEEMRRQYDAGEIDSEGNETPRRFYREYASAGGEQPYHSTAGFDDLGGVFADLFGRHGPDGGENVHIRMRGGDVYYTMEISFLEAVNGAKKRVVMPDGKALDIAVPAGVRDGEMLRLGGKGGPGLGGAEPGDAYVKIHVIPHLQFRQVGNDIHLDLRVALHEAVLGAKVPAPTAGGQVMVTIPPGSNSGSMLRLKGKGVPAQGARKAGDQIVTLRVVLPEEPDAALKTFLQDWAKDHTYDPRRRSASDAAHKRAGT